jgi:IS4 transposase
MALYRCRWQVELLFKELKSHTNWKRFTTALKAIVDGLAWYGPAC